MKRQWIEYGESWKPEPLSYWVHIEVDGFHDPPLPKPVPGKSYATFFVELDGFTFRFASLGELDHCVDILSRRVLPTSRRPSEIRGAGYGPNNHWLSRLPKGTKSWKYRQKAVSYLKEAREVFARESGSR